jgi:DNA-binding transcriptional regulator LsrR (DeoR family)
MDSAQGRRNDEHGRGKKRNLELILRIARMRYEERRAQCDIARQLRISEAAVSRALKAAMDLGLIEIRVQPPLGRDSALERRLRERFPVERVVVVKAERNPRIALERVGQAVAEEIAFRLADDSVIGVGDGESVAAMARSMPRLWLRNAEIVPLIGGVGQLDHAAQPTEVAREIARRTDARVRHLPVPAVMPSAAAAAELIAAPAVHEAFAAMARCSLALVGVGALDETLSLLQQGVVTPADLSHMRELGAIGMICGRAFDRDGRHISSDFDERLLSASIPVLGNIPTRFAVAFGERKAPAIRALLKSGLVNGLGTDAETARLALG